jgi:ATP-dependent DNA ligase
MWKIVPLKSKKPLGCWRHRRRSSQCACVDSRLPYHAGMAKARRSIPAFIEPMAAQAVQHPPEGLEWLYKLKLDCYRAPMLKDRDSVRILSRKNNDLTRSYSSCSTAILRATLMK